MNCDQVFDALTRGPFPTGDPSDSQVERHLTHCGTCSRLAEALRPATELFQEAIPPEASRDLPAYWGDYSRQIELPARICLERRAPELRLGRGSHSYTQGAGDFSLHNLWRLAAAVALGVFCGSFVHVLKTTPPSESGSRASASAAVSAPTAQGPESENGAQVAVVARRRALTLTLPTACCPRELLPADDQTRWVQSPVDRLYCCTHCHNAGNSERIGHSATARVQQNCHHCHEENQRADPRDLP